MYTCTYVRTYVCTVLPCDTHLGVVAKLAPIDIPIYVTEYRDIPLFSDLHVRTIYCLFTHFNTPL